jgi:hypothetical protein
MKNWGEINLDFVFNKPNPKKIISKITATDLVTSNLSSMMIDFSLMVTKFAASCLMCIVCRLMLPAEIMAVLEMAEV